MGRRWGQVLALAIGLAPVFLLPLTWTPHGPEPWMRPLRDYAVTVLIMEIVTIVVALSTGLVGTLLRIRLPRPAAIAAAVLALVMAGTIPFAPVPEAAATGIAAWIVHIFFGLSIVHLIGTRRIFTPTQLVRGYAVGFALFCGLFALLLTQLRNPGFDWGYDLPAFGHVRIIGHYAAPVTGFAAGMMASSKKPAWWAFGFAVATLAFALTLWTGSRGALLGAAAGLIAGLLFARPVRRSRAWAGFGASFVLAWVAMSQLPAEAPNMGAGRIVSSTVRSSEVTTGRSKLWPHVTKAVAARPLFGYGEGQMFYVANFANLFHPHNVILQILLAWGFVGLTSILILAFYFARASIYLVRTGADEMVPPFIAMVALAAPSLIDGSLFHLLPVSIFAACAGMMGSLMLRPIPEV